MKRFWLLLTAVFAVCLIQNVWGQQTLKLGVVGSIEDNGDSIWLANTKEKDRVDDKAVARLGYDGAGKINLNGRDIELKMAGGNLPEGNFKIGKGGYEVWKGKDVVVRLDYVYTWLCPEQQENCSVYYYEGQLDIFYRNQRRKVKVVGFGGS